MNRRRLIVLALATMMVVTLVGPAAAQAGKTVTLAWTQEPDNLNYMYSSMWFSWTLRPLWLAQPWVFNGELVPQPLLVTEIPSGENGGISEDGTVITLNLRDDIVWSDGEPITSADFLFTYEMMIAPENSPNSRYPYDPSFEIIASVEAPDERTVVVTFTEPFAPWLVYLFMFEGVVPEHVLRPVFEAEGTLDNAEWNRAPTVGSGPFVFSEWESGSHILLVRNENYFDEPAKLDAVLIRFVPDDAAQIASLINGDADIGTFVAYGDLPALEEAGVNVQFVASGYNEAWFLNINPETAHPAMLDVNVRRALALAAPFQQIVDDLLLGRTHVPASYWEGTPYASPDVSAPGYDPEEAARLLDEAGWVDSNGDGTRDKDGVELVLRYLTPPRQIRMDTQVVVQQAFAELGVGLTLENPSYDIFWNSLSTDGPVASGEFDIAQWSQNPEFPDPNTPVFLCSEIASEDNPEGSNWTHYCNEEVDALFQQQTSVTDFDQRVAIFHQIDELMHEDYVWIGVWYDPDNFVYNSRVINTEFNGANPFWNAANWDIAE